MQLDQGIKLNAVMAELRRQSTDALNRLAQSQGDVAAREALIAQLSARIKELEAVIPPVSIAKPRKRK